MSETPGLLPGSILRCSWCLEGSLDSIHFACPCCGNDLEPVACQHREGQTLGELFRAGVRLVRREPWASGNYLELVETGQFMLPFGLVHSPLEWPGVPAPVRLAGQRVPLWMTPRGGWEAYTGETVDEATRRLDAETPNA